MDCLTSYRSSTDSPLQVVYGIDGTLDLPVDEETDFGAHGDFDTMARSRSWQWWATAHRDHLLLATSGVLAALGARRSWKGSWKTR